MKHEAKKTPDLGLNVKNTIFYLPLANGFIWQLKAIDPEIVQFVKKFAYVLSMRDNLPGTYKNILSCEVNSFKTINKFRKKHPEFIETGRKESFRIFFEPGFKKSFMFYNMDKYIHSINRTLAIGHIDIALQLQIIGHFNCVPCHSALVEINGRGAVIGGRGDSGKSTCASRIPSPHRALADDYIMLFEHRGEILAQPMPTWSNLINGDAEYRMNNHDIIKIDSIFFLKQSSRDYIEPIYGINAVQHANTAMQDLLKSGLLIDMPEELNNIRIKIFNFAEKLIKLKPAYLLYATLEGDFWNKMDEVMSK